MKKVGFSDETIQNIALEKDWIEQENNWYMNSQKASFVIDGKTGSIKSVTIPTSSYTIPENYGITRQEAKKVAYELLEKYKPEEHNMFFVTTKGKKVYSEIDYSSFDEVFLLFGKETKGLSEDILKKYIRKTIRIPMRKTLRSLNLSNSVAIVAYDVIRQINFEGLEEISNYFDKNN